MIVIYYYICKNVYNIIFRIKFAQLTMRENLSVFKTPNKICVLLKQDIGLIKFFICSQSV